MLVVDLHPLEAVDILDLIHNVAGELFDAFEAQNVVWIGGTVHNEFPFVDHLTIVHQYLLFFGNQKLVRSEEHTSELQSRGHLVCRLLLEKKKNTSTTAKYNQQLSSK